MKVKKLKRLGIGCLIFLVGGLALAMYFVNKKVQYLVDHPATKGNTVSIILIDGLSQSIFEIAIANNQLPNIKSLMDNGTYIKNGIGSFPSMTGYAYYPFITGMDATKSGILGLRWFDRSLDSGNLRNYVGRTNVYMNQDITDTIKNIFELSGKMYTGSINSFMNKGVDDGRLTGWTHTTAKFKGKSIFGPMRAIPVVGEDLAKDHFQHETEVMNMAKDQLLKNPKVQWVTFPSPDASHHVNGMEEEYLNLLKHIDGLIGSFKHTIDSLGQRDTRMIAIVTDHGVSDVSKNIDIEPVAKKEIGLDFIRGNAVNYRSMQLKDPLSEFVDKDGYWVINGNLAAYLYLRDQHKSGPDSWRNNLSYKDLIQYQKGDTIINIPKSIAAIEGIQLVIYKKDDQNIIVENKDGFAVITKKYNLYQYHTYTADPLKYENLGLVDTFMTKEAWIDSTIESNYPDAIYRLYSLMEAPTIGDLVITSEEGYDLAKNYEVIVNDYKGGHGGLRGDQLRVPYILYTPNSTPQQVNYARSEEVGQQIISWLNFPPH